MTTTSARAWDLVTRELDRARLPNRITFTLRSSHLDGARAMTAHVVLDKIRGETSVCVVGDTCVPDVGVDVFGLAAAACRRMVNRLDEESDRRFELPTITLTSVDQCDQYRIAFEGDPAQGEAWRAIALWFDLDYQDGIS